MCRVALHENRHLELTGDLRLQMLEVSTASRLALDGDAQAFDDLEQARQGIEQALQVFHADAAKLFLSDDLMTDVEAINRLWIKINPAARTMVANKAPILFLHEVAGNLNAFIPDLQREQDAIVKSLIKRNASSSQVSLAQRQSLLAERIARNIDKMLGGSGDATQAADQAKADVKRFGEVMNGMRTGNSALGVSAVTDRCALNSLNEIAELYALVNASIEKIFKTLIFMRRSNVLIAESYS